MGDLQVPPPDDLLSEKENVDVDVARPPGDAACTAQRGLDLLAGGQQWFRGLAGLDLTTRFRKRPWCTTPTGSVSYTEEQRTGSTPRSSKWFKARAR